MRRLTRYLARLFVTDALILFGVVCVLLWMVNCLRLFEVVSVKGQSFGTLALQALYTMPPLVLAFFYVCIGIGMVRALLALQSSHELHIIHTGRGLGSLWRAAMSVAGIGLVAALLIAHWVEPRAVRSFNESNAAVAADLVSSTLRPGRFTQVTPGVVLWIGGRAGQGQIERFFADDRRTPEARRTYVAEAARVSTDGDNYVIELRDGALQYVQDSGAYSEIRFTQYDISVESLSQAIVGGDPLAEMDSFEIVQRAMATGEWPDGAVRRLTERSVEGLRVIAICMFALAVAGFPSGRRTRIRLPLEAFMVLVAFAERGIGAYSPIGTGTGALLMIIGSAAILVWRLRPRRLVLAVPA